MSPIRPKLSTDSTEPRAEQVLPDAIDHHAGRQRVVAARDPLGQFEAAALLAIDLRRLLGRQRRDRKPRGTTGPKLVDLAANANGVVGRLCAIAHGHREPQALDVVASATARGVGQPLQASASRSAVAASSAPGLWSCSPARSSLRSRSSSLFELADQRLAARGSAPLRDCLVAERRRACVYENSRRSGRTPARFSVLRKMPIRA